MRVAMAVAASLERKISVAHVRLGCVRDRFMTLLAGHPGVHSRQHVTRLAVIEAGRGLPGLQSVAAAAIGAELPAVLVGVTSCTACGKPHVGVIQVFDSDQRALLPRYVVGIVASRAREPSVFAF